MSKVTIERKIEIDYGHTLPNHFSFCNQIHGHRGIILAKVRGDISKKSGDSSEGMVMDFKFLKEIMMEHIHDVLDHGFAVWDKDEQDLKFIKERNERYLVLNAPPTAENLAKWAFFQIVDKLPDGVELMRLSWYETPTSRAIYDQSDYKHDIAIRV